MTLVVLVAAALYRGTPGRSQPGLAVVGTNVVLSFATTSNQVYYVQRRDNLATGFSWSTIASNIVGTGGIRTNIDTGAATALSRFYRIGSVASGTGTVFVADKYFDGSPATGAYFDFIYPGGITNSFVGPTDNMGFLTFTHVPVGGFTVRALHPSDFDVYTDVTGMMPSNGALVSVTTYLPCLGTVEFQVYFANTNNAAHAQVILDYGTSQASGYADDSGHGNFLGIPSGSFTLTAFNPNNQSSYATVSSAVPSNCVNPGAIEIYLP
jgi:hypothetical protein